MGPFGHGFLVLKSRFGEQLFTNQVIQSDLFDAPVGGHLTFERVNHPKKVTKNCQEEEFSLF